MSEKSYYEFWGAECVRRTPREKVVFWASRVEQRLTHHGLACLLHIRGGEDRLIREGPCGTILG